VKYKRDGTPLTGIDRAVIHGKNGYIYDDETEQTKTHVFIKNQSPEKWPSMKKKLSFMRLAEDEDMTGGHFTLKGDPTPAQAAAIRKTVGLKKRPALTDEHRAGLRKRLTKDHTLQQAA
jgi:hypothetical protein